MADDVVNSIERGPPAQAWRRYGVAKIPELLSPQETVRLQRLAGDVYAALAGEIDRASTVDADLRQDFLKWQGVPLVALRRFLRHCEPALEPEFREIVGQVSAAVRRRATGAAAGLRYWRFLASASNFRRHLDDAAFVPWHIDADAAGTATISHRCFNIWLPLEAVGSAAPSLQLIPGSHRQMRRLPLQRDTDWPYRTEEWVGRNIDGQTWTPSLQPGDAILFDQYILHRTQRDAVAKPARTSCEFRFVDMPQSWLPLARRAAKLQARKVAAAIGGRANGAAPAG